MSYAENQKILSDDFSVAGTSFRKENLILLIKEMHEDEWLAEPYLGYKPKEIREQVEFGEKLYKYEGFSTRKVELVPEPDNEHDKNAIKVLARGIHVGYIPKDRNGYYNSLLQNADLDLLFTAQIIGGPYKTFDFEKDKVVTVKNPNIGLKLEVRVFDKSIAPEVTEESTNNNQSSLGGSIPKETIGCLVWILIIGLPIFTLISFF